ncbi:hypothetical protein E8L99_11135 [Phreatobacter aquaticus]|uniref:Uncharacterized protein n=1 Tax=Phreatobacter aquaticus TaxID=2570229 RepID=A0A4D7QME2_9HYPH|nr:hypothetical protein [Phreatobacter aquaticus]QCK86267.1 hypothetical protein E8L99_11135 [Phreatobacter aquaticus]
MSPRIAAIVGAVISTLALGVAVAQIMPSDRARLPSSAQPQAPAGGPLRPAIRDVTPGPNGAPASPPAAPPASPAAQVPRQAAPAAAAQPARPATRTVSVDLLPDNEDLRERVGATREKLILAAKSGNIERLGVVFQMNETTPVFTRGQERDPIAFWKQASGDGQGHEILAILLNILDLPAAHINKGTPQEMYVWPYLAHVPLATLTPQQSVDLYRLMTAQDVRDMRTLNSWVFWRLGIGPDGTLHFFLAGE